MLQNNEQLDVSSPLPERVAAVDLGSNSFHMMIAEEFQGELRTLEKRGQKVQLASGLDENNILSEEAMVRGIECLREFGQRLQGMSADKVVVFATNALRAAQNRHEFIERAEAVLGYPIEVIAGREEARLIYLGVSHTLADLGGRRLVIDIGGGSTEFIIGEGFEPLLLESLHMGCVSFTQRYFKGGAINRKNFNRAIKAASQELLKVRAQYRALGWSAEVGSSGTIRAVEEAIIANGWGTEGITSEGLDKVIDHCMAFDTINDVEVLGVRPDRRAVFIGGLAILRAVFDSLKLTHMLYSDGALREGALWDLTGRAEQVDVRERTIKSLQERFYVDVAQSGRVEATALALFDGVGDSLKLPESSRDWLIWAARLHEVGLTIAHSGFHKHGGYLLQHSDMLGFTRQGQALLSFLVRNHRRKLQLMELDLLPKRQQTIALYLIRLLRLAVVLNHSREAHEVPVPQLILNNDQFQLALPEGWLDEHPLTRSDLEEEVRYQEKANLALEVKGLQSGDD